MNLATLLLPLMLSTPTPSRFQVADPAAPARVDYLVVAADDYLSSCDALLALRQAQGLQAGAVGYSQACAAAGEAPGVPALVAFLRHAHADWGTRYVLLVGGALGPPSLAIPMEVERARYFSDKFDSSPDVATDFTYSTLGGEVPVLHVGRFPARSLAEAQGMADKTVAYETASQPGPWQRRIAVFAGQVGLNPAVDTLVERVFTRVMVDSIPAAYNVEVAYARPDSPYCPWPPGFHANAVRLINEGSLLCAYVGHGARTGCDDVRWRGQTYPILDMRHLGEIDARTGLPVMVVIACWTGQLDSPRGECVAEGMLKLPAGPVAVLACSRICQPYGNAILGQALLDSVFGAPGDRLGAALDRARARLLTRARDAFRRQVDPLAGMVQGLSSLEGIRADTARDYNLLGDPALLLHRPAGRLELEATRGGGGQLLVTATGDLEQGTALVSVECPRDKLARKLDPLPEPADPGFQEAMNRRYASANDRAYVRAQARLEDGHLRAELTLPPGIASPLIVKAFVWNATGSAMGALELRSER